jgi:hypothetical protein
VSQKSRTGECGAGADALGTATGGYGRNAKGSSFSRANQMGTDESPAVFGDDDDDDHPQGYKTGSSTPGYRQEGGESQISVDSD